MRRLLRTGRQPDGPGLSGLQGKDHFCQDSIRPRARPATSRIPGLPRYALTSSAAPPRTFTDSPMDMSISVGGGFRRRLVSRDGYTAVSHIFVMEWAAVVRDIVLGLLIAGAVGAWVPDAFWRHLFLTGHPLASKLWGPLIGPVISMLSFVCSIGNVPLAGVLWNGGISFGGVVAFIFADLIIIPILIIYRKYYGTKMMLVLLATFYATMVIAAYIVEFLFSGLGLVPAERTAKVAEQGIQWNYTTFLNIIFLLLAAALLVRFFRSGGGPMLKMMGGSPDEPEHAHHASCHAGSGAGHEAEGRGTA